jgi:hypothetical protein
MKIVSKLDIYRLTVIKILSGGTLAGLFDLGGGWVALPLVIFKQISFSLPLTPSLSLLHSA